MKRLFIGAALAVLIVGFCAALTAPDAAAFAVAHAPHIDVIAAMGCLPVLNARARGIYAVRAEASNAEKVLVELKQTFETFKAERNLELKEIKSKLGDVVQTEKVDRINDEISKLQKAMDDTNALMAAVRSGLGEDDKTTPEMKEHAKAFNAFFRKGAEAGLRELEVKAAGSTDSSPDGGYLVPEQMESTIDRVLGTVSAMRGIARVITISTGVYEKIVNQGGSASGWVGEREARPATANAQLAKLAFQAMELYAMPSATQTLLDDARVSIEQWLADEVSITFAEQEGAAFITGDGVNKPRGILGYGTVANASYAWGSLGFIASGVAADINDGTNNGIDGLTDLVYSIKQGYRSNANFMMNRTLQGKVRKLKSLGDTAGYLWQPSAQLGQPATMLGYPVVDDDNMPDVGANAFPVAFGDFRRGYLIVDRFGIRVLRDPFTNKPYVNFYTTKRVGGGVQNFEAIKLFKCAA